MENSQRTSRDFGDIDRHTPHNLDSGRTYRSFMQESVLVNPPPECQSLEIVTAVMQAILKSTDNEIQWLMLAPQKVPFTTKNAQINAERVLELCNLRADNFNDKEGELSDDEDEPKPGAKDELVPNQTTTKIKPAPISVMTMKSFSQLEKLIKA